jgi:O-antigen/teichoic acid export membrane protein
LTSDNSYFEKPVDGLKRKVTRGAAWTSGLYLASKAGELVFTAILARLLAPTEFGVVAAAMVFIQFAKLFVEIGIGATIVQLPELTRTHVRSASTLVALNALLFFGVAQATAPLIAGLFAIPHVEGVLRLLAFIFLLQAIGIVPENLLVRRLQAPLVMVVEIFAKLIGFGGVGALCAFNGLGYWSLAIAALSEALIKAVTLAILVRPPIMPTLHGPSVRALLSKGSGFSVSRVLNFFALYGDKVIAGRFLGAAGLGIYGRAYHLMSVPADLYGRVAERLMFPALAACQDNEARLRYAFLSATSLTATLGLPLSAVLVLLAPEIVSFLLGSQWAAVIPPFMVLAVASYFRLGAKTSGSLLRATGSLRSLVLIQALYAAMVIGGGLIAVQHGIIALGVAMSASAGVFYILITAFACARTKISATAIVAAHLHGVLLAVLMGAAVAGLVFAMRAAGAPDFVILAAVGALMIAIAALLVATSPTWLLGKAVAGLAADVRRSVIRVVRTRFGAPAAEISGGAS